MSPYVIPGLQQLNRKAKSIDDYIDVACDFFQVSIIDLSKKTRVRYYCEPRQMIMAALCECTNYSLKTIGEHFGGRDHTTVLHSKQTVRDLCLTDKVYSRRYSELVTLLMKEKSKTILFQ